jgi:hypothetical protein
VLEKEGASDLTNAEKELSQRGQVEKFASGI